VFYKLKYLSEQGVKIHLHTFTYRDKKAHPALADYCATVNYYPRKTGFLSAISTKPYIVKSRIDNTLIDNLSKDNYPILFDGLHTCGIINNKKLLHKKKIFREHNIEHDYYYHLYKAEKNIFKKIFFLTESIKLKRFESILEKADVILSVNKHDTTYFKKTFPKVNTTQISLFHENNDINIEQGKGKYALYHGNLEVSENSKAAEYLIKNIFSKIEIPFIISGNNPPQHIIQLAKQYAWIKIIANPDNKEMLQLIRNAHVHTLITFQPTGLKLKLLNTLFNGRFIVANSNMLYGTTLSNTCNVADNDNNFQQQITTLFNQSFGDKDILLRQESIKAYTNNYNIKKLLQLLY